MGLNKTFIFVSLVVAVFAVYNVQSAKHIWDEEPYILPRANTSFGSLGPNDFLLYSSNAIRNVSSVSQIANVPYVGFNVNITYIYAMERGPNQFATVSIISGGINQSNATVRIMSAVGRGFNYTVYFYGRNR